MRLLADENIKERLVSWLKANRHDVKRVDAGTKDPRVFELSKELRRVLLTSDTNFLNTDFFAPKDTPGRIVLRTFPPTLENQKTILKLIFSRFTTKDCRGKLIEVWSDDFRVDTK